MAVRQVQSVCAGDGLQPCKCRVLSVVNYYAAHAFIGGWGLFDRGTGRRTYPSSLIWQTKLRVGTEAKETAVRTQEVVYESTAFFGHT